jgi:probable rRNA maturation factor
MQMSDEFLHVDLQVAVEGSAVPPAGEWLRWAGAAARAARNGHDGPAQAPLSEASSLTIRLVDRAESEQLNATYRKKSGPTNVLAFAGTGTAETLPEGERELGDLVVCLPVLFAEAAAQGKDPVSHMAHLTIHGTLHLLGYDHEDPESAELMESLEISIMARLGYPDPYSM